MQDLPSKQRTHIRRERDVRALSNLALLLCCALGLAGGFVFAARLQFAAVQFGYESENLRRERDQLLQDQQRLLLQKEQASVPSRLESAARQLGLRPVQAGQVGKPQGNGQSTMSVRTGLIHPSASLTR